MGEIETVYKLRKWGGSTYPVAHLTPLSPTRVTYSWASLMIKVRHRRDAKRRVYDELSSLDLNSP